MSEAKAIKCDGCGKFFNACFRVVGNVMVAEMKDGEIIANGGVVGDNFPSSVRLKQLKSVDINDGAGIIPEDREYDIRDLVTYKDYCPECMKGVIDSTCENIKSRGRA